jgi:glucoamylase
VKCLVDVFAQGNASLQTTIQDYVTAQATVQSIVSPSGNLASGTGLGEPKFNVNETAVTSYWPRPQRDGPALRVSALVAYGQWLVANGHAAVAATNVWPIVRNDLAYVAQFWNQSGYDLWEEVDGSSFWTVAVSQRALVEGNAFAELLHQSCDQCLAVAAQIRCFQQSFWSGAAVTANINLVQLPATSPNRSGLDANSILTAIHVFDPDAPCDDSTFQPCSPQALANHKAVVDSFRGLYPVNQDGNATSNVNINANTNSPNQTAIAIGRYPEDVYQGGNPWYLCTLAAAEQLYDALYQWSHQSALTVTATSLPFFQDLDATVQTGSYATDSPVYAALTAAVRAYADGFVAVVQQHTPSDGRLAEQFSKAAGTPLSAADLTWSYAAFITAAARRAGAVGSSWGAASVAASPPPTTCAATTAQGSYTAASPSPWPSNLSASNTSSPSSTASSTAATSSSGATVGRVHGLSLGIFALLWFL